MDKVKLTPHETMALLKAVITVVKGWQQDNTNVNSEAPSGLSIADDERIKKWKAFMKRYNYT